jgi:hypothetical protein
MPANLQEAKLPFASPGHYRLLFPRSPPKLSPGGAALNQAHPNAGGKVVVEIAIDVDPQQNSRGYAGSPVSVGTTPLKPNQPKSSSSTNNTDYSNLASVCDVIVQALRPQRASMLALDEALHGLPRYD